MSTKATNTPTRREAREKIDSLAVNRPHRATMAGRNWRVTRAIVASIVVFVLLMASILLPVADIGWASALGAFMVAGVIGAGLWSGVGHAFAAKKRGKSLEGDRHRKTALRLTGQTGAIAGILILGIIVAYWATHSQTAVHHLDGVAVIGGVPLLLLVPLGAAAYWGALYRLLIQEKTWVLTLVFAAASTALPFYWYGLVLYSTGGGAF